MVISESHIDEAREAVGENFLNASKADWEEYTYAISHAMETDQFVGSLVERLETDNLLEDTVLVFFTDHYGKYMTNHELLMELKGAENGDMLCETPFFIYQKGMAAQKVETISSTADILPTLANMFGLQTDYRYYDGVDIFSDAEHYVVFQGNNWYDGETYFSVEYDGTLTDEIKTRNQEVAHYETIWSNLFCACYVFLFCCLRGNCPK
jgi:arylsulfatase A-like enzyme